MASVQRFISNANVRLQPAPRFAPLLAMLGAAALAVMPLARAAAATPTDEPPTVSVSYGDLDISTEHGARVLLQRIEAAAQEVCPQADARDLGAYAMSRRCERGAVARAVQRVGSPQLAALSGLWARHG